MVSIDGWLDHMLIPYQVTDFLTMLVGEFRTNFDFADAVKNRTTSLSETFAGSVSANGLVLFLYPQSLLFFVRLVVVSELGLGLERVDILRAFYILF